MWGSVLRPCPVNEICFHSASPPRGSCLLTEKSFVFLLRSLLCSHWERSCLPIGNTLIFLLGKVEASHWEHDFKIIFSLGSPQMHTLPVIIDLHGRASTDKVQLIVVVLNPRNSRWTCPVVATIKFEQRPPPVGVVATSWEKKVVVGVAGLALGDAVVVEIGVAHSCSSVIGAAIIRIGKA